jgi:DNA-binding CsgD family transcriptional regulator
MDTYTQTLDAVTRETSSDHTKAMKCNPLSTLSAREIDVVQQLVDGHSTDAASAALFISRHTFRTHVKNISRKLDTHTSLELVSLAVEYGMRPSRLIA